MWWIVFTSMKEQLITVKPALAGMNPTSPTSRMVKIQDGRLWAYGGAYCISVPIQSDLDCGFYPEPVAAFFSSPRIGYSLTSKNGRLYMKHGKTEVSTPILPASEIPVLAVIGNPLACEPITTLAKAAKIALPGAADYRQAICFRDQQIYAAGLSLAFASSGLSFAHPDFYITPEAAIAIGSQDCPITGVTYDRMAIQFDFTNGVRIAARLLELDFPPTVATIFEGEKEAPIEMDAEIIREILSYRLSEKDMSGAIIDLLWSFKDGNISFRGPNDNTGTFEDAYNGEVEFRIKGENLRKILETKADLLLLGDESRWTRLLALGEGYAVVSALTVS